MKPPRLLLAIESSCDDTAAAVIKDGREILASMEGHQFEFHKAYQGVVPELASRAHVNAINKIIEAVLLKAFGRPKKGQKGLIPFIKKVDAIAVTVGPGLAGSLLVGKMTAEALGWAAKKPVIGVNHIEGHLLSPVLADKKLKPPFLGLVASGGHTELIFAKKWGIYFKIGSTLDDAAGEAFDKVAKMMNLGYPGGPVIDKLARLGDPSKEPFPKPWIPQTWNFSFSGLKTSFLYRIQDMKKVTPQNQKDLSAGFQESVVDVLAGKTIAAAHALKTPQIVVGGGVAANSLLRSRLTGMAQQAGFGLYMAPPALCADNAAMVGAAAYFKAKIGLKKKDFDLTIRPQWSLPAFAGALPPFKPTLA